MTQLLDSPLSQNHNYSNQLQAVLKDIVNQVEIRADFSVRHPDYKPLDLPEEAITRFQKMPAEMQQKYLSLQLRSFSLWYLLQWFDARGFSTRCRRE